MYKYKFCGGKVIVINSTKLGKKCLTKMGHYNIDRWRCYHPNAGRKLDQIIFN